MHTKSISRWVAPVLFAGALGLTAVAGAGNQLAPITLKATSVATAVVGRSDLGAPVTIMTATSAVHYADLNLATRSGAATLVKRVRATAWADCQRLSAVSLMAHSDTLACVHHAESAALREVRLAVTVAHVLKGRA